MDKYVRLRTILFDKTYNTVKTKRTSRYDLAYIKFEILVQQCTINVHDVRRTYSKVQVIVHSDPCQDTLEILNVRYACTVMYENDRHVRVRDIGSTGNV